MEIDDDFDGPAGAFGATRFYPSQDGRSPPPICPRCSSSRIKASHRARTALGTMGTLAGAVGATTRAWTAAQAGASMGAIAGPPGAVLGAVTAAVLAGLTGGTSGCAVGIRLGELVDTSLLKSQQCLDCQFQFQRSTSASR